MLFESNTESPECFICFDDLKDKPIQLKNQTYYYKKCKCNNYIHKKCLDDWYENKHKCPICRNHINKILYFDYPTLSMIYKKYCTKKNILRVLRIICGIIFIYYSAKFYAQICKQFLLEFKYDIYFIVTTLYIKINLWISDL